ncbi:hypothetical protein [Diaminobutyricimonas sp. LJ205]|uniref:DUF6907 domain-containing protein n=1 Tax=Diaminobutyricimonas sp. LJ205 TaxID=2683590 RepID=UPI0012F50510|nr:hypothetical protein [Diaminobutyricimonas sp. LJ205]
MATKEEAPELLEQFEGMSETMIRRNEHMQTIATVSETTDKVTTSYWWTCPDWCELHHIDGPNLETDTHEVVIFHEGPAVRQGDMTAWQCLEERLTIAGRVARPYALVAIGDSESVELDRQNLHTLSETFDSIAIRLLASTAVI